MAFLFQVTSEGDGTTFNRHKRNNHTWAGRWADFYESQRHPQTWKLRKCLGILLKYMSRQ